MGGGQGFGYGNSPSSAKSFLSNLKSAIQRFPLDRQKKFGSQSLGRNVQVHKSSDPQATAMALFHLLSKGGKIVKTGKPGTRVVKFDDGTHITFRVTSKSNSPAIDINPGKIVKKFLSEHKIHFEKD